MVGADDMARFIEKYAVGRLVDYRGVEAGVENTNYFVDTSEGRYVLTLFEQLDHDLPYFLDLMAHVADAGLPGARPLGDRQGQRLQRLKGRPAALVTRLPGASVEDPEPFHCRQVGHLLAEFHHATRDFRRLEDARGARWRQDMARRLAARLDAADAALLEDELARHRDGLPAGLPSGLVHADLFRDNVLFEHAAPSGLIDLYYACEGPLLYDVAVTVNDWCRRGDGSLSAARLGALLDGYRALRPFEDAEKRAWPDALRLAALRFWLSRLVDAAFPRTGHIAQVKNPDVFRDILLRHREGTQALC